MASNVNLFVKYYEEPCHNMHILFPFLVALQWKQLEDNPFTKILFQQSGEIWHELLCDCRLDKNEIIR